MTTISDVARAARVSPATVSRVLNQPDIVAPDKRDRVLAAIAELNYLPSPAARSLRRGSLRTLALLVGDISQPFHGQLAKTVERAAEQRGYSVLLCDLDHRRERLVEFLHSLPHRGVDGVVLATADNLDLAPVRAALTELLDHGVAAVCTSQRIRSPRVPAVVTDHRAAGREATEHLLERGSWPVVFLGGGRGSSLSQQQRKGYLDACRAAGRQPPGRPDLSVGFQADAARAAVTELLDGPTRPRGVVAVNTPTALGAIQAIREHGLDIPADVAIVSCEEVPMARFLSPPLTAVDSDLDAMGSAAVDILLSTREGVEPPEATMVPHTLVVRASSAVG